MPFNILLWAIKCPLKSHFPLETGCRKNIFLLNPFKVQGKAFILWFAVQLNKSRGFSHLNYRRYRQKSKCSRNSGWKPRCPANKTMHTFFWKEFPSVYWAVYFCHYVGESSKWVFMRWFMKLLWWMKWVLGRSGTNFQTWGAFGRQRSWTPITAEYCCKSSPLRWVKQSGVQRARDLGEYGLVFWISESLLLEWIH